jgi:hypothetical protein
MPVSAGRILATRLGLHPQGTIVPVGTAPIGVIR